MFGHLTHAFDIVVNIRGQHIFFCKGPDSNTLSFSDHKLCCNFSTLPLQYAKAEIIQRTSAAVFQQNLIYKIGARLDLADRYNVQTLGIYKVDVKPHYIFLHQDNPYYFFNSLMLVHPLHCLQKEGLDFILKSLMLISCFRGGGASLCSLPNSKCLFPSI